jgi:hypothetical protein
MLSFPISRHLMVATFSLFSMTAAASAENVVSCRTIASAAANEWSAGRIAPADDAMTAKSDEMVLISYGHKYIVPRRAPNHGDIRPQALGSLAMERNQVYQEELERCLGPSEVTVYVYPQ